MRRFLLVAVICILSLTMLSGCGLLQKLGLQSSEDELQPVSSIVMGEEEAKKLTDKVPIHLYFTDETGKKLILEVRYITLAEAKKSTGSLASLIVNELINGPSKEKGLKKTLPDKTKLNKTVSVSDGVATVDLSNDFVTNHPKGKEASTLAIYSIVNSLTELKEVQKVKFLIDGKERTELGSFKFNSPFPRNEGIISKEVKSTDKKDEKKDDKNDNKKDDKKDGSNKASAPADGEEEDVLTSGDEADVETLGDEVSDEIEILE